MSDNKDAQAARNAADRRLREAHPNNWRTFMQEEFAQRGLEWTPRPSKEERERKAAEEKEARALARIAKIAKDNGLSAEAANRVLIAAQGEVEVETGRGALTAGLGAPAKETIAEKVARIGNEAEKAERRSVVDSGSYADDIVNERSAPMGGWR